MTVRVDSRDDGQEANKPSLRLAWLALVGIWQGWRHEQAFSRAVVSRLLLAFVLAVALWAYVTAQGNPVRTVIIPNVPIVALGLPTGYVVNSPLGTVSVQLQGLDSDLRGITSSSLQASVDGHALTPGSPARLLPVTIRWPGNRTLTLQERTPDRVRVGVDVTSRASVQVAVVPLGQPPAGYQPDYAQEAVDPPLVTVTGLSSAVSHIQRATVEVDLSNAVNTVNVLAVPKFLDAAGHLVSPQPAAISPAVVKVTIPVRHQLAFNSLPVVAQLSGTPAPGYYVSSISVSPPAVTVWGEPGALVVLHYLTVRVSQEGISGTQRVVSSYIDLPRGVGLSPDEPVSVTLQAQSYREQADLPAAIALAGAPRGWTVTARPAITVLRVSGPAPQIAGLGNLKVGVDVSGLGVGHHRLVLKPRVPAGVALLSATPNVVDVVVAQTSLQVQRIQADHKVIQSVYHDVRLHSTVRQIGATAHAG